VQCTISAGAGTPTMATLLQVKGRLVGYRADRRHTGLGLTSTLPPGESTPPRAEGLLAFGIGSEAGPTRSSDPTRCRCRALAACGIDSLDGPPPGLPDGISAWSGNELTENGGPCVDTRRRVRACLLGRRVPNESSTADGRDGQEARLANGPVHGEQPPVERHARRGTGRQYRGIFVRILSRRDPGCIDVSASAAVEAAGDQRRAVTYPSGEGDGAAALHGAPRSRRQPFG
jgi:hypothetical protein